MKPWTFKMSRPQNGDGGDGLPVHGSCLVHLVPGRRRTTLEHDQLRTDNWPDMTLLEVRYSHGVVGVTAFGTLVPDLDAVLNDYFGVCLGYVAGHALKASEMTAPEAFFNSMFTGENGYDVRRSISALRRRASSRKGSDGKPREVTMRQLYEQAGWRVYE